MVDADLIAELEDSAVGATQEILLLCRSTAREATRLRPTCHFLFLVSGTGQWVNVSFAIGQLLNKRAITL